MISKNQKNAWILLRGCIDQNHRKVKLNNYIFEAVDLLDELFCTKMI